MIVLDTETTGVDPKKCSIVSIGAIEFERPENQFYGECRPWEGAEIDPKALQVNGFTESQLVNQPKSHKQLIEEFLDWIKPIKNKTLAGQNVWFDVMFFKASVIREGYSWSFGNRYVDSHSLAYEHFSRAGKVILKKEGSSDINIDKIFEFLGIEGKSAHTALEDAKMTAEILSRFIYGKNLLPQYAGGKK